MVSKHILYVPAQAVAQDGQWVTALLTKCDDPWEGRINITVSSTASISSQLAFMLEKQPCIS